MLSVLVGSKPSTVLGVTGARPAARVRPLVWLGVAGIAAIVIHACGYVFGTANQTTYFIEPLRQAHPELYRHDWFAATTQYHRAFSFVASWLFRVDDRGAIACAVANAVVMAGVVVALFWLVAGVAQRRAFVGFVLVTGWILVDGGRSMAGSYLWAGYLQPSLLGTLGWIVALGAFVRGRPLATGLAAAAGGAFHANYLVLGLGVFTLAELVTSRSAKRVALVVAPQLVVLAFLAPDLFASASGEDPDLALWILTRFHATGHYLPGAIARHIPQLMCWLGLAIVVAPIAVPKVDAMRRLATWGWIAGAISVLAVPVLLIPGLLPLTRLYVWRLAPFARLVAMIVIALAVSATVDDPSRWRGRTRRAVLAIALAAWLAWTTAGWAIAANAVGIALALLAPRLRLGPVVALVGFAFAADVHRQTITHPRLSLMGDNALYAWARADTPVDAVFLTPPRLNYFRLHARRAVVVDLKSPPLVPDELVAWYRRIGVVVGLAHAQNLREVHQAWDAATHAELMVRARGFGAQYLVVERAHDAEALRGSIFASDSYVVYPVD